MDVVLMDIVLMDIAVIDIALMDIVLTQQSFMMRGHTLTRTRMLMFKISLSENIQLHFNIRESLSVINLHHPMPPRPT